MRSLVDSPFRCHPWPVRDRPKFVGKDAREKAGIAPTTNPPIRHRFAGGLAKSRNIRTFRFRSGPNTSLDFGEIRQARKRPSLFPSAIAASQSCTHFPVDEFQTLRLSSAALTPRYFFNQMSAGAAISWSNLAHTQSRDDWRLRTERKIVFP